jgi:hypothetical protein
MAKETTDGRSPARPDSHPDWSLAPSPTPGFSEHNAESAAPNPGVSAFTPRSGEGSSGARSRVIGGVLDIARSNGGKPAANG